MPVMLQVRNLPDDIHAKLKLRAKAANMSLSDYVTQRLAEMVATSTLGEIIMLNKASGKPPIWTTEEIVAAVRELRGPLELE